MDAFYWMSKFKIFVHKPFGKSQNGLPNNVYPENQNLTILLG